MPPTARRKARRDAIIGTVENAASGIDPISPRDAAAQQWAKGYVERYGHERVTRRAFRAALKAYLACRDIAHPNEKDGAVNVDRCIALATGSRGHLSLVS